MREEQKQTCIKAQRHQLMMPLRFSVLTENYLTIEKRIASVLLSLINLSKY